MNEDDFLRCLEAAPRHGFSCTTPPGQLLGSPPPPDVAARPRSGGRMALSPLAGGELHSHHESFANRAFASCRSAVSKPSVNQS